MKRPFQAYDGDAPYVFVCYSHADRALVYAEIQALNDAGFNIWYDEGISPGSEWSEVLARSIDRCSTFLYFVSPRSIHSEHCRRELNYALDQRRPILAVHLEHTDLPPGLKLTLSNRQAVLKYEEPQAVYETKLKHALADAAVGNSSAANAANTAAIRIGDWLLDVGTQQLSRGGESHALDPKTQSVLLHLVDRAPEVVSREGLLDRTWRDTVVGDNVLDQAIAHLRKAFGDNARHPEYIETLHRRGYRLVADVTPLISDTKEFPSLAPGRTEVRRRVPRFAVAAFAAALLLAAGVAMLFRGESSMPTNDSAQLASQAQMEQNRQIPLWVAPVDAPDADGLETLKPTQLRTDLVAALVSNRTVSVTDEPTNARFLVQTAITDRDEGRRLDVTLVDAQSREHLWHRSFRRRSASAFVHINLLEHLLAQVSRAFMLEHTLTKGGVPAAAARHWTLGNIEFFQAALGAGGNMLVAAEHFRESQRIEPLFWGPEQQLIILHANQEPRNISFAEHRRQAHRLAAQLIARLDDYPEDFPRLSWEVPFAIVANRPDLDYRFSNALWEQARHHGWNAGQVHVEMAANYTALGEFTQAIALHEAATAGDAQLNHTMGLANLGWTHMAAGNLRAAHRAFEAAAQLTLNMESDVAIFATGSHLFSLALLKRQGWQDTLQQAYELYGDRYAFVFAAPLAIAGRHEEARAAIHRLEQSHRRGNVELYWPAVLGSMYLNDYDQAFVWLDRAIEKREPVAIPQIKFAPYLDPLRRDERFAAARQKLETFEAEPSPLRKLAAKYGFRMDPVDI